MSGNTMARLYYLAVELRPKMPPRECLRLLGKSWSALIESGAESGLGGGMTNYEQLQELYMRGAESGAAPTDSEFRALLAVEMYDRLEGSELQPMEKIRVAGAISGWAQGRVSIVENERVPFSTPPPPDSSFSCGLPALDAVTGGSLCTAIVTLLAKPGNGKSSFSLALAKAWCSMGYGSVWMFEPEQGKGMTLRRIAEASSSWDDCAELFLGHYKVEDVLRLCREEPDPGRLVILDSLHAVCGDGSTPESRGAFTKNYEDMVRLLREVKLVFATTQIKRGSTPDDLEAAAGSSAIERYSAVLIGSSKGTLLPDGTNEVKWTGLKNRLGVGGLKHYFSFDYATCTYRGDMEDLDRRLGMIEDTQMAVSA